MTRGIFPNTDSGLLSWSLAFSNQINADPESFGLSAAQASAYAALHAQFAAAMVAVQPNIRSKAATAIKKEAREALKNSARMLASLIYGTAGVTDAQKIELGLTVRKSRTAAPVPDMPPGVQVVSVKGFTVKLKFSDFAALGRRGKPPGVAGAAVFSYVSEMGITEPPTSLSEWRFEGNTGQLGLNLNFSSSLPPGTQVWFSAFWFNTRHKNGPACSPVTTHLQGGAVAKAA